MDENQERELERQTFIDEVELRTSVKYESLIDDMRALGKEVLKLPKRYRSHSSNAARFLSDWKAPELGYARIITKKGNDASLNNKCLDPSMSCGDVFKQADCSILMSGTLTPVPMYADILGLSDSAIQRSYTSSFPKENRLCLMVPGLTTKYSMRSPMMYEQYGDVIGQVLEGIPGNTAVFFPSYQLMSDISSLVETEKTPLYQMQNMTKNERSKLFDSISCGGESGSVLFGVQAGSFSEGLDYANNLLDAVVIVGLPLERPDLEVRSLIEYYDFKFGQGFDYGYVFPAMNRTLQAAGRCIRSETDRGAIVLLDERFAWANYRRCFPEDFEFEVTDEPRAELAHFFRN